MDASLTLQSPSRKSPREIAMSSSINDIHKSDPTPDKSLPTTNIPQTNASTSSSATMSNVSIVDDHRNGSVETRKLSSTSNDPDYMNRVGNSRKSDNTSPIEKPPASLAERERMNRTTKAISKTPAEYSESDISETETAEAFRQRPSTSNKRKASDSSSTSTFHKKRAVSSPTTTVFEKFHTLLLQFKKTTAKLRSVVLLNQAPDVEEKTQELASLRLFIGCWLEEIDIMKIRTREHINSPARADETTENQVPPPISFKKKNISALDLFVDVNDTLVDISHYLSLLCFHVARHGPTPQSTAKFLSFKRMIDSLEKDLITERTKIDKVLITCREDIVTPDVMAHIRQLQFNQTTNKKKSCANFFF